MWDEFNMGAALDQVKNKLMGYTMAAKTFNVPRSTLRRRFKKERDNKKGYLGGYKPTFDIEMEEKIAKHVVNLETRFYGLTQRELRKLVFQLAEKHKIPHRFNKEKGMAGRKWLRGFLSRNPNITIRTPEPTSLARAGAFNRENIRSFFTSLAEVLDKYNFTPENIYNVDETGMSTVATKPEKILATKGRKQIGVITSAERGQNFTIVGCVNVLGRSVPPAFIFPRKRMKAELMDGAPISSIAFCQENGWMTTEIFVQWLQHFVQHVQPNENKVLLILDGHSSHKGLEVLEFAKENGIILFCLPPHCTHRLQPLDVGIFAPLQTYYNEEIQKWLKEHPGRTVTHFQVAKLFNNAYLKAFIPSNAINSFRKTGIFPFNPDIFEDWEYAAAITTDKPQIQIIDQDNENNENISMEDGSQIANTSKSNEERQTIANKPALTLEHIEELSPLPKADCRCPKKLKRKRGKTGVINSTPDIEEIKEKKATLEKNQQKKSTK